MKRNPRAVYEEYLARFKTCTNQELVDAFNREVGKPGWVSARASYLAALHEEFKGRAFDFSAIGGSDSFSLRSKIRLIGNVIEPLDRSGMAGPVMIRTNVEKR